MVEDPRGDTLKRGTSITLVLKEEAYDYLEQDTIKNLVKKYSQFINFNIYMWTSKTEQGCNSTDIFLGSVSGSESCPSFFWSFKTYLSL